MDGLEAVAHVGQGAADDDAHRVVEVAGPQLVLDADAPDVADLVSHAGELLSRIVSDHTWLGVRSSGASATSSGSGGAGTMKADAVACARLVSTASGRRRMPARRGLSSAARPASADRPVRASRTTQARAPSSVWRAVSASRRRHAATPSGSTSRHERRAHESAFWTSGSASPMSASMIGKAGRVAQRGALRDRQAERQLGQCRADQPTLPAMGRVDEELDLRPPEGLQEHARGRRRRPANRRSPSRSPGAPGGARSASSAPDRPACCGAGPRGRPSGSRRHRVASRRRRCRWPPPARPAGARGRRAARPPGGAGCGPPMTPRAPGTTHAWASR